MAHYICQTLTRFASGRAGWFKRNTWRAKARALLVLAVYLTSGTQPNRGGRAMLLLKKLCRDCLLLPDRSPLELLRIPLEHNVYKTSKRLELWRQRNTNTTHPYQISTRAPRFSSKVSNSSPKPATSDWTTDGTA